MAPVHLVVPFSPAMFSNLAAGSEKSGNGIDSGVGYGFDSQTGTMERKGGKGIEDASKREHGG